jgi:hypothetical protein
MNFPPYETLGYSKTQALVARLCCAFIQELKGEPKNRANYKDAPSILLLESEK